MLAGVQLTTEERFVDILSTHGLGLMHVTTVSRWLCELEAVFHPMTVIFRPSRYPRLACLPLLMSEPDMGNHGDGK